MFLIEVIDYSLSSDIKFCRVGGLVISWDNILSGDCESGGAFHDRALVAIASALCFDL